MKPLKEKIEVMQAALDGKEVEWISLNNTASRWTLYPSNKFDWGTFDFRIKQEPMEFWVNVYPEPNYCGLHTTWKEADEAKARDLIKTIKVREVTE